MFQSFIICCQTTPIVEIFHILQQFFICHNVYWGWLLWDSHYLRFFHIHFHSTASSHSSNLSITPSSIISSITSCTKSSAYLTVWITCPPILNSLHPSTASYVRYLLYKLNRISYKQHSCLISLQIFIVLVSPWYSHTLTFWFIYNLLINLLSCQSTLVSCRVCIHLVQFTVCQSMQQTHNSSSMSKVYPDIIISIPTASLVPFPLLNPNWPSASKYSISFQSFF